MGAPANVRCDRPVVILGAGLTGLSTAYHLGRSNSPFVLAEREQRVGGHARSYRREGYTFDVTGHWLHLRDERIKTLVRELFGEAKWREQWVQVARKTQIYTHGVALPYPFQANLHGLPLEVVKECLVGLLEAQKAQAMGEGAGPQNFEAFATARFGAGIARHFFVPYNTKLWGMHPDELTADWVSRFIPIPEPEQIIAGAIGLRQEGLGYNAHFLYPKAGGIDALPDALAAAVEAGPGELSLGCAVEEVDLEGRRVKLSDREDWQAFGALVSTIPLPELIRRIQKVPAAVRDAAQRLRCVRWRYLDVATKSPVPADYHWVYVPEERFPFFRVGVYSNAVAAMAPPGAGSLYVELTDREGELDLPEVARGLAEVGALKDSDDILFAQERRIEYAYVLFDDDYQRSRAVVLDWIEQMGVRSCGRYGAWIYNSMEDSMIQGLEAAKWADRQREVGE